MSDGSYYARGLIRTDGETVAAGVVVRTADLPDVEFDGETVVVLSASDMDAEAALNVLSLVLTEDYTLTAVSFQCDPANPPTGSAAAADVNLNGTSLFSTQLIIDSGEYSTATAASPPVLTNSPTALVAGDILVFDLDQVGVTNPGKAYKIVLHWTRTLKD